MKPILARLFFLSTLFREFLLIALLFFPDWRKRSPKQQIPVVVSMTSFPPRIGKAWIAIETLLRQSVQPEKILLVLNTEEFPDRKIPSTIRRQVRRGLEIHWLETNGGSYDKLLPALRLFPQHPIVTVDDDKFFPRNLVELLWEAYVNNPGWVVGARGWVMKSSGGRLIYGNKWVRAEPGARGRCLFVPGGNGCLYPPGSLHHAVLDTTRAVLVCPTADDIWFWAALLKAGSKIFCLGLPPHKPVLVLQGSAALSRTNVTRNAPQFQQAISHWGIIKELESCMRIEKLLNE